MEFFRYLKKLFCKQKLTNRQKNIELLIAKINKIEIELRRLKNKAYIQGACCPSCYFGPTYSKIANSQLIRIKLLKKLIKGQNGKYNKEFEYILSNAGLSIKDL